MSPAPHPVNYEVMDIIDTQPDKHRLVWHRRRRTAAGVVIRTIEIPWAAYARHRKPLEKAIDGGTLALITARRQKMGEELMAEGWEPAVVARLLGVSDAVVQLWRSAAVATGET